ncbi:hypothetical protein X753_20675 [Mesorhizobium sp. LNJC399B00]|uniref:pYEATS domain-containing protein n=1 Tax=unclassified Mesorhizobium TaxID=325217 RepID=UPI0003CF4D94|nr:MULTISPECIES: pYEATS domain-containing protein [unclassified Mesorhizobium]ESY03863.1 hypothetical protein X753_20675 [Mesorhizobium sp. LNJC399B00]WJI68746.1 hypothetical protein NLY36_28880 [Mesorhizobium sp. C399B]
MSTSDGHSSEGILKVIAPKGVAISITHGPFNEVAQGFNSIDRPFPEGIYTVRYNSAGRLTEQVVRVSRRNPLSVVYDGTADRAEAEQVSNAIEHALERGANLVIAIAGASNSAPSVSFRKDFKLRPSTQEIGKDLRIGDPIVLGSYLCLFVSAQQGAYKLSYKTVDRISVEQTIYLNAARTTVAMMKAIRASRPEKTRNEFQFRSRDGIDPASTRIFSVGIEENVHAVELSIRLAVTLLSCLAKGSNTIEPELLRLISEGRDPYFFLYATAALLGPVVLQPNDRSSERFTLAEDVVSKVESLLEVLKDFEFSADVDCVRWRLALGESGLGHTNPFSDLSFPPMLERCWRWATAWSATHISEVNLSRELLAASQANVGSLPWLVWRRKGNAEGQSQIMPIIDSIESIVQTFANNLRTYSNGLRSETPSVDRTPKSYELPNIDLSRFSAPTLQLAASALRLGVEQSGAKELLQELAVALKSPVSLIAQQMQTANNEVLESRSFSENATYVLLSSDPLKGKFGGSPSDNGYTLSLRSWESSNNPEFLALYIAITRGANYVLPDGIVRFYLHPTFNPSVEPARWLRREAKITLYAMGGFTLGAQTEDGTRVELDLALDDRLPQWFRDR